MSLTVTTARSLGRALSLWVLSLWKTKMRFPRATLLSCISPQQQLTPLAGGKDRDMGTSLPAGTPRPHPVQRDAPRWWGRREDGAPLGTLSTVWGAEQRSCSPLILPQPLLGYGIKQPHGKLPRQLTAAQGISPQERTQLVGLARVTNGSVLLASKAWAELRLHHAALRAPSLPEGAAMSTGRVSLPQARLHSETFQKSYSGTIIPFWKWIKLKRKKALLFWNMSIRRGASAEAVVWEELF